MCLLRDSEHELKSSSRAIEREIHHTELLELLRNGERFRVNRFTTCSEIWGFGENGIWGTRSGEWGGWREGDYFMAALDEINIIN